MPTVINIRGKGQVSFPDGVSEKEMQEALAREFPASGEDIDNEIKSNPEHIYSLSDKDYEKVRGYRAAKPWPSLPEGAAIFLEGAKHIGETVFQGGVESFKGAPMAALAYTPLGPALELGAMALEGMGVKVPNKYRPMTSAANLARSVGVGATANTLDLVAMVSKGVSRIAPNAPDTFEEFQKTVGGSRAEYYDKLRLDLRDEQDQATYESGVTDALKSQPLPDVAAAAREVVDPSMFIPAVGQSAKLAKLAGRASLATKGVGRGAELVEATGRAVGAAARIPENLVTRGVLSATDDAAMAARAGGYVSSGAALGVGAELGGLAIPGVSAVSAPIIAGKVIGQGLETAGELARRIADEVVSGPNRLSALERIAANPAASASVRATARVGAMLGADTAGGLAASALEGSLHGAVIGGALGAFAGGAEGFYGGLGSGAALGAGGGLAGRSMAKLSGAEHAAKVVSQFAQTVESRADGSHLSTFAGRINDIGALGQALDLVGNAEGLGVRVIFHDNASKPSDPRLGGQKYAGATVKAEGGNPATVYINVDNVRDGVVPHELFHAIATESHLKQLRDTLLGERVGGEVIRPGVFGENDFKGFAEAYMQKLSAENKALMQSQLVTALDKSAAPAARWEAQRAIVDEVGASYAQAWAKAQKADTFLAGRIPTIYSQLVSLVSDKLSNKLALGAQRSGFDFSKGVDAGFSDAAGKRIRVPEIDKMLKTMLVPGRVFEPAKTKISLGRNLAESMALVRAIGAEDLVVATKSGARLKTKAELQAENLRRHAVITSRLAAVPKDQQGGARIIADAADRSTGTQRNEDVHIFSRENPASSAQIEAIVGSGIYNQAQIDHIRRAFQSMSRGDVHEVGYLKATEGGKAGAFEHSMREMLPYSIEVNKASVLYFRSVDITKVRGRLDAAFARPEFRGVYGSKGEAWSALSGEYLRNLSEASSLPSADVLGGGALGERRRNFFYEVMGTVPRKDTVLANPAREGYVSSRKGGSVYESFRFERVTSMAPTAEAVPFSAGRTYQKSQINYRPADVEAGQARFMPAGDMVVGADADSFTISRSAMARFMPASHKVRLEDYADRKIIALAADRMGIGQMSVGPKGAKRDLSVRGQGGRGFMNIFNGGGWAFSDETTANRFISRLKKDADSGGNATVGITIQSPINHLKNQTGQMAYIEAMQAAIDSKTVTQKAADSQIAAMSEAIVSSEAKSITAAAREKFRQINTLEELKGAVKGRGLNFSDMDSLLTQMQRKKLPITEKELAEMGMTAADIARDLADPELADAPFGSVVALLGVNVNQAPSKTSFHHSYPWTVHGEAIGFLDKFYNVSDLSTEPRIRNKRGAVSAQPLQMVMPVMDNIINTIKAKQGIPSDISMRFNTTSADIRFMPVASFDAPMAIGGTTVRNHPSGYRTTQRAGGAVRLYGKSGSLMGVYGTVDEANGAVVKAERAVKRN